jgi:hypothetical protein
MGDRDAVIVRGPDEASLLNNPVEIGLYENRA